ncbi:MAG: hypothetical protein LBT48_06270 [Prevotellaceae bacterium]|jgi:hypothetical protein|nr:hypothetical protein [Prevotellaceae bacterium]
MFFETIYRWFASLFGGDLADFLSGYVCATEEESDGGYLGSNQFVTYGFIALGIALAVMLVYYYVINHPRFNRWWSWLLMLLVVGLFNIFIGALMTSGDLAAGNIDDCLINGENGGIYDSNCWMFGLANVFVSAIFFVIFSIGLKWWSTNCKRSPF